MKKFRRTITVGAVVFAVVALSLTALAADAATPAAVAAEVTGQTVENVTANRMESRKTYGAIASDAGKLEEFKGKMFEAKKAILKEKVASGAVTQEKADAILEALENNMASCDGSGSAQIGSSMGAAFGGMGGGRSAGREGEARGRGSRAGCAGV